MSRKDKVARSFSAAAAAYEQHAQAQAQAARALADAVLAEQLPPAPKVLEIGCGTGLLSRLLMPRLGGQWLLTDIAPAMLETAKANLPDGTFRIMDGEHPDVAGFDLIVSNLAFQWFADLPAAIRRLKGALNPGGLLAFTTLGSGSFMEWRAAHAEFGLVSGMPAYPTEAQVQAMGVNASSRRVVVSHQDAREFLAGLKAIGAATPVPGHRPLAPGALRKVIKALGAPVSVTYDVILGLGRKEA